MPDIKKILQSAKKGYNSVIKESQELKKYIENIKGTNSTNNNSKNILTGKGYILGKTSQQNIKKVVYEEESDSEPEIDESEYIPEEIEEETEKQKPEKKQHL